MQTVKPHYNKGWLAMGRPYTTKVPAHAVTRGQVLYDFGDETPVHSTEWVMSRSLDNNQYIGTFINGVPYLYNQPVEIIIGAATKR